MPNIQFRISEEIKGLVEISNVYVNYTQAGNPSSFGIDLQFDEINKFKAIKSKEIELLPPKIEQTLATWEGQYLRQKNRQHSESRKELAEEQSKAAKAALDELENILTATLEVDDTVDWDSLKRKDRYSSGPSELLPSKNDARLLTCGVGGSPKTIEFKRVPGQPQYEVFLSNFGFFKKLFGKKSIEEEFAKKVREWEKLKTEAESENKRRKSLLEEAKTRFEENRAEHKKEQDAANALVDDLKSRYDQCSQDAVEEYCDMVLSNSEYPDFFPKNWDLEYRPENKILVIDYQVPAPESLPDSVSFSYVKSRDEINEKKLSETAKKKLFESVIYQTAIRTIHELFEADSANALDMVGLNGMLTARNPSTGVMETKVIASVSASKDEFSAFDLSFINPKDTFKHLKGVSASKLADLTPIPPVLTIDKKDKRFIDSKEVVKDLAESVNLAAMDWSDFEHLIRELFEQEFVSNGGEVNVTQASSDGGVDAIAFDPDPIRGGKIVIQAKRYTNTVGVAAVRDLYGTVLNEGATKGILVTTSDYGKDSYSFAQDKPLTLLSGANLLSMLEKHGHKARIDVQEAKKING